MPRGRPKKHPEAAAIDVDGETQKVEAPAAPIAEPKDPVIEETRLVDLDDVRKIVTISISIMTKIVEQDSHNSAKMAALNGLRKAETWLKEIK